ncbi:SIR2 family protein [Vibrio vulnificus]|uniref:P-loop NTPase n=1 Tax=Vibrio vulnificus TaxID=672 RepID=UPI00102BEE83|nr:SIR2 family protein [Vibrio vulnificus]EME3969821.1 SIR2 family protein [Vibrio fluvialis]EHY9870802.1 SIR2 family protein [Vibrio vulnificus]EIC2761607.1 SIR2 family protein [Vibrio vulnificus]ELG4788056.1 SIR2 family protein [Vibrio vulnificus]RZR03444.1 cold-shock protein [Vibrio vulnificus]
MNPHIKKALLNGRLVLLFGAGASRGSKNSLNQDIPLSWELAEILARECGFPYKDESLADVYSAARSILGGRTDEIFEQQFKHCVPSPDLVELAKFPFVRIYTLNIDDAFDRALYSSGVRKFNIRQRHDKICDPDQFFEHLDFIKLNGDVHRIRDGFVFSQQEYASGSANPPLWYEELAQDYLKYTFIFIGTKLNEPLFKHQVERYKGKTQSSEQRSYILVPELSPIEAASLKTANIQHLPATLNEFVSWLKNEFEEIPTNIELLRNCRPHLSLTSSGPEVDNSIYDGVTPVARATLSIIEDPEKDSQIKSFYKGYKPSWHDIMNGVPAKLKAFFDFYKVIREDRLCQLYTVEGPAGSGKSTLLKQLALQLAEDTHNNVYFLEGYNGDVRALVDDLERKQQQKHYVFVERLGDHAEEIGKVLAQGSYNKIVFIGAENQSIYKFRVEEHLKGFESHSITLNAIDDSDVDPILSKIKEFGNWTRLGKMTPKNRRIELIKKAKRQLLIGLLEVTSGEGFDEIIRKDYLSITNESQRYLLLLAGLSNSQGVNPSEATLTRALSILGVEPNVYELATRMEGIVKYQNGTIQTRHRVYIDRLFERCVSNDQLCRVLTAYIEAFSVYNVPIVPNIGKQEAKVYKHLVNAKTVTKLLSNDEKLVLSVYKRFEKIFEADGLFLMQYGLALRSFGRNKQAYEKLRTAFDAYSSSHVEHALAQQRIILSCEEEDETVAQAHFDLAEEALSRLDKSDIRVYDRYPIIALSEGHVQFLDKFGRVNEGKIVAKMYYDKMAKKKDTSPRMQDAKEKMMKYYLQGKWVYQDARQTDW